MSIRIRCERCRYSAPVTQVFDGVPVPPAGWSEHLCPQCLSGASAYIPDPVMTTARKVARVLQSLIATELSMGAAPGDALVLGQDGATKRMRRVRLLTRRTRDIISCYGIEMEPFAGETLAPTTLEMAVQALNDLICVEAP